MYMTARKKKLNLQDFFFLFLVNLTEREHSQGQTWGGGAAVTAGIEPNKKKKQEHFSLLSICCADN